MSGYAHPEVLVDTQWVEDHLDDSKVRFVEVGWNTDGYDSGHIQGATAWVFNGDVIQTAQRNILEKNQLEALLSRSGVANNSTVVLHDGFSNLLAAMAFWMLKIYGHQDVRLLNGGRGKWASEGHPMVTNKPTIATTTYKAKNPDWTLRAHRDLVQEYIGKHNRVLVDARSADMYSGQNAAGAQSAGHIPGAVSIPAVMEMDNGQFRRWLTPTTNEDGTFKSVDDLRTLFANKDIIPDKEVITYCVLGGLSSHMWFVLKYLLGYPEVREYDGSWAEWGNLIGVPIARSNI